MLVSTASGVWEPDDAKYGVMQGDLLAVRSLGRQWACFDARTDPGAHLGRSVRAGSPCSPLVDPATNFESRRG